MKTKLILTFIITGLILTQLPFGSCFGAEPEVSRDYIARKIGGVKSTEERVSAEYKDLSIVKGNYVKIIFLKGDSSVVAEYEIELTSDCLLENGIKINTDDLLGTEYVKIELIQKSDSNGVKVPLNI